ncbi:MAG: hypothetical protein ACRDA5_07020 [Clostridium sp.]
MIIKNGTIKLLKTFLLTIAVVCLSSFMVNATPLEERLNEQNEQLNSSIDSKELLPDVYTKSYEEVFQTSNASATDVATMLMNIVKKFAIDGRDIVISAYALYILIALIWLGIFGSRDLAKRKVGIFTLIGVSLMFLFYINLPLILLYIQGDKSLAMQTSLSERINSVVSFLQNNSFIIAALVGYVGITKLIVSKNDLTFMLQGRYLVKFSVILLVLLNTVPVIIKFLI